jgi:hypothetical protein
LAKEQSLPIDAAGPSGARTHDVPFAKREHYHLAMATGKSVLYV